MLYCNPAKLPFAIRACRSVLAGILLAGIAGCTVEPLNRSLARQEVTASGSSTSHALLASAVVDPVSTRAGQQVRNKLLFALNGGNPASGGNYRIKLKVVTNEVTLLIAPASFAPTAAQAVMNVRYELIDTRTGKKVTVGNRRTFASFDKTTQSFANERAYRDAENRAAAEIAQQIRLALVQAVSGQ